MIHCKNENEVELLRASNILVSKTLAELAKIIGPGVTTKQLDTLAETFIRDNGAKPAFKGYHGFPATLCTSVNEAVVHGFPNERVLREGDILSVDCGVELNGYVGDSAFTFAIGEVSEEAKKLLEYTRASLEEGIKMAIAGNRIGDVSHAVQQKAESGGFSVVREFVGHGIGKKMHEAPEVPNFGRQGSGTLMRKGLVICIEPMINMGNKEVYMLDDGWTVKTVDGKYSAHFEKAVAVDKGKADVLTTYDFIDEILSRK